MGTSHNHHYISDNNTDPLTSVLMTSNIYLTSFTIFDVKKYLYYFYLSVFNTSPQNANYYYYYCINTTTTTIIIIITDAAYELLVIIKLLKH